MSDQIDQAMHRLLSLEMSLSTIAKSQRLNFKAVEARTKALRTLQTELHRSLHLIGGHRQSIASAPLDHLVPSLSHCTPVEQQIYSDFAQERRKVLEALATEVIKLRSWARSSASNLWGWLTTTLRLAKTAKLINTMDRWISNVSIENNRIDLLIRKTVHQLSSRPESDPLPGDIDGLMKIFNELDATGNEIAGLRESIRSEEQLIIRMRAWLQQEEKLLNVQPYETPSVDAIEAARIELPSTTLDTLDRTKERLTLARRFADEYSSVEPVVESFIGKAASRSSFHPTKFPNKARVGS